MWGAVASGIFLVACVDFVFSDGNGPSLPAINPRIAKFKTDVNHIFQGARIRVKRQLEESDPLIPKLKLGRVTQVDLPYLSDLSLSFWLSIESANQVFIGTTDGTLMLFKTSDDGRNATLLARLDNVPTPVKARAFSYYDEQWFVVLHDHGGKFSIQLYKLDGRSFKDEQPIPLKGSSDIELIEMKGIYYLVVSTYSTETNKGFSYQASVTLYYWAKTQFDITASSTTYGSRSLDCWTYDGSLYIAVGQEINDEGNMAVGSPIYLYNNKEETKLVIWQILATDGPSKVRHFYSAENMYLIFTGKQDAVIYWWSSGQFLEWQTLQGTANALDVSVLSFGDEAAVVITLKDEALFYTLDTSGYYVVSFTMSFKGSNLESLQFMSSRSNYYALALFTEPHARSTWRLELDYHFLPSLDSLDTLQQCLLDTQQIVANREAELNIIQSDIMRIWLKGSNQIISSKVIVKGSVTSKDSRVKDVVILKLVEVPRMSFSFVVVALSELEDSAENTKRDMETVVLKSNRQNIQGIKHFKDPVYVPSLRMESTDDDISINDVKISRLNNYALRKISNQEFPHASVISNVYAETVNVDAVNGISTNDLLLLSGKQIVTGSLDFVDVATTNMLVKTINSIPLEDIVTTTTPQIIKDLKMFSQLTAQSIDVQGVTNEVDLDAIYKKIAIVDNYNEFLGQLKFQNPLTVNGNMSLTSRLNKVVDISKLVSKSVDRDSQQDLTGFFTFKSGQTIDGDIFVTDLINGVSTDNLLTIDSDQIIFADIVFNSSLTVARDAVVEAINNVDIGEQAVQKMPERQFISGMKHFQSDIKTDFVDMSDYVTLDDVDPSLLVQDIVQHQQGVVNDSLIVFSDVDVLGNVTVTNGLNGYNVQDLLTFWLKSTEQTISVPVKAAHTLHFKHDLQVLNVSGLDMENDFVSSYTNEVVESSKIFQSEVVVKSLKMAKNAKVNGINPRELKSEMDHYERNDGIHGTKKINSLEISGDLKVMKLNGLKTADILRPNDFQVVLGPVEFTETTSILDDVKSDAISFGTINGLYLQDYFRTAVTLDNPSPVISNKHFGHLKATNLSVPSGSKISGVDLQEMMQRVVFLNAPQLITASKSFVSAVNFTQVISTSSLNGLNLSEFLDEVVLTDEVSKIQNKRFIENVQTPNIFVRGKINEINLEDVASNVFYKSEDNEVTGRYTFIGDIDVGHLSSDTIDGVKWDDLVLIKDDQDLKEAWFLTNVYTNEDVFMTGLLNGCDLSFISSSIYANGTTQVINKRVNVNTLVIIGNLEVKKKINEIPLELLRNFISLSEDQVLSSNVVMDSGLAVDNLILGNLIDSHDVEFLLADAVRHSVHQEIKGYKEFKGNLNVIALDGGELFVSKLDGVDLEELRETAVLKKGYQEIEGDKIFTSLFINAATISGFLNGLKLPQDVVTTYGTDHISSPTYFMSNVYVAQELFVHGLVDGVDIDALVKNRVTLNTEQNITAHFIFYDDVKLRGELTIEGTINDIVLELVAKTKSVHSLQGYKVFLDFYVANSLSASSVNGYNINQLNDNILRHNHDDYINEIQTFQKPIYAQNSLYTEWINGIPMRWLEDTFFWMVTDMKPYLEFLRSISSDLQQKLIGQLMTTQGRVSRFAYFTLHQEINLSPATRFLRAYDVQDDRFLHSFVMWAKEEHCIFMEMCCHLDFSYWLRVTKSGILMVDRAAEPGRYYPILDPSKSLDKEFFIWTNSTNVEPKLCGDKSNKFYIAAYSNGLVEEFIGFENAPLLSDVKSFRKGQLYAVAAFYFNAELGRYGNTTVYAYHETGQWYEHQRLPSSGALSLDIVNYNRDFKEDILLAVGAGMDGVRMSSTVYKWDVSNRKFDILQNISSRYVPSTLWIKRGKDLLLSLANVEVWPNAETQCSELVSGGQINIYLYKEKFEWVQSIPIGGIVSMVSFSIGGDTYLAAASSLQETVYIFEWRGYSGFVQVQSISTDVKHLNVYNIDDDIYMTIASGSSPSKVLKLVRKGIRASSTKYFQDELSDSSKAVTGC